MGSPATNAYGFFKPMREVTVTGTSVSFGQNFHNIKLTASSSQNVDNIEAGTKDGRKVLFMGTSDSNTITFRDNQAGTNLELKAATRTLADGEFLCLQYDSNASKWREVFFTATDATETELEYLSGVTAGTITASKALVADANGEIVGVPVTDVTTVDASAGGSAQTTNCTNVPANSLILNVTARVVTPFDGDTTQTLEVGVSANADKYIDTVDFDPSAAAGTSAVSNGGTTNDQTSFEHVNTATQLIATWTNTASAAAGEVEVYVTYIPLS